MGEGYGEGCEGVVGGKMRGVVRGEVKGVVGMWPEIYEANV